MGLLVRNEHNLTGNTLLVGDLVITWDHPEEDEKGEAASCSNEPTDQMNPSGKQSSNT